MVAGSDGNATTITTVPRAQSRRRGCPRTLGQLEGCRALEVPVRDTPNARSISRPGDNGEARISAHIAVAVRVHEHRR
jgi:hypothetical protein